MATHWVYKEIYSNRYICNGKPVEFEPLDGNSGVGIFVDGNDEEVLKCLKHAADNHAGGIVFITENEYHELKKNRPWNEFEQRQKLEKLRVMPYKGFGPKEPGAVAAETAQAVKEAGPMPAPTNVPTVSEVANSAPAPSEPAATAPKFRPATKHLAKQDKAAA